MSIIDSFLIGMLATGKVMAIFLGGLCAVIATILVLLICTGILAAVFDLTTWLIAKRLAISKKEPRGRIGKILVRSVRDGSAV